MDFFSWQHEYICKNLLAGFILTTKAMVASPCAAPAVLAQQKMEDAPTPLLLKLLIPLLLLIVLVALVPPLLLQQLLLVVVLLRLGESVEAKKA